MIPGETVTSGASWNCAECGVRLPFKVCHSAAGYYIGTFCNNCGPYSRESGYYPTFEAAQYALDHGWPSRG